PTQEVIVLAVDAAVVHGIETLALAAIDYAAHGEAILLAPRHGFGVQMQQAGVGVALGEGAAEIDVAGPGDADAGHFRARVDVEQFGQLDARKLLALFRL